jgi:hypothetical protein
VTNDKTIDIECPKCRIILHIDYGWINKADHVFYLCPHCDTTIKISFNVKIYGSAK